MAVFIGRILLTAELLNEIAAPLIKNKYRIIKTLTFRIVDDSVVAEAAGKYSLIGFKSFAALRLCRFHLGPSLYRIEIQLSVEMQPRFLKPLLMVWLKRRLFHQPGLDYSENLLQIELAGMPLFRQLIKRPLWGDLISKFKITRGAQDPRGLLFNLYLLDSN